MAKKKTNRTNITLTGLPIHITKLAVNSSMFTEALQKVLADYNILHLTNEQALKLFYEIIGNMIHYLDTYPGHYFKLGYVDIYTDEKNLMCIKGSSDYEECMVDADLIFNKFCSEQAKREELEGALDLFAQTFFGKREKKYQEARKLSTLIRMREDLYGDAREITREIKGSAKYKRMVRKRRKERAKEVREYFRKKKASCYAGATDFMFREKYKEDYKKLELELRRRWIMDRNNFPIEGIDNL